MIGPPRRCPGCPSTLFHRSRRTKFRRVLKLLCVQPFRCDSCGHRQWRFNPLGTTAQTTARPQPTPAG